VTDTRYSGSEVSGNSRWMKDTEFCNQIPHFTKEAHMKL